mmetsp:Transcript_48713/g.150429  ORF Transcript_48713/g.150429 Transcript_48713/m.150429 type:complete len:275 (-) Transcript_48713:1038-1862(-)
MFAEQRVCVCVLWLLDAPRPRPRRRGCREMRRENVGALLWKSPSRDYAVRLSAPRSCARRMSSNAGASPGGGSGGGAPPDVGGANSAAGAKGAPSAGATPPASGRADRSPGGGSRGRAPTAAAADAAASLASGEPASEIGVVGRVDGWCFLSVEPPDVGRPLAVVAFVVALLGSVARPGKRGRFGRGAGPAGGFAACRSGSGSTGAGCGSTPPGGGVRRRAGWLFGVAFPSLPPAFCCGAGERRGVGVVAWACGDGGAGSCCCDCCWCCWCCCA